MAQRNTQKIRDLNPAGRGKPYGVFNRYNEFLNLLMNAVQIKEKGGKPLPFVAERLAKQALFEGGAVGYDAIARKWAWCYGQGINEDGNPTSLIFVTRNGKTWTREATYGPNEDGAFIIYALPDNGITMGAIIREVTDFMTHCDEAMRQNVEACKTPYIVTCKDADTRLSLLHAIEEKQHGQAVVLVDESIADGLRAISITTPFLVDKFAEVRNEERDTLLNKLGIMTANTNKRERVQSAEVNASIGQAVDYIYLIIDTFNKQMESYGLPFEMAMNGAIEEIYLDGDDTSEPSANEIESKGEIENGN